MSERIYYVATERNHWGKGGSLKEAVSNALVNGVKYTRCAIWCFSDALVEDVWANDIDGGGKFKLKEGTENADAIMEAVAANSYIGTFDVKNGRDLLTMKEVK